MPSFEETAHRVWKQLRPGWRSTRHAQVWLNSLERHVFPLIGEMPVSEVTSADVIRILAPMWHEKARQPVRPGRPGARSAGEPHATPAGVAARRGGGGDPDGADVERAARG